MHIAMPNRRGFTLVELLVAIALISILLGLAVPSFSDWLESSRLKQSARDVLNAFQTARLEAIKHNTFVSLSFTAGAGTSGVVEIFIDDGSGGGTAGNCTRENCETVVTKISMAKDVTLFSASFSGTATGFNSRGLVISGHNGSVKVKNSDKTYTLSLAPAGCISLN